MNYKIDIVIGDYWNTYAETNASERAQSIADMLLKKRHTVRISRLTSDIEFGEIQEPSGPRPGSVKLLCKICGEDWTAEHEGCVLKN